MDLNAEDRINNTPLHVACEDGNVEVVRLLLEAGANPAMKNKEEKTPLEMSEKPVARVIREWMM